MKTSAKRLRWFRFTVMMMKKKPIQFRCYRGNRRVVLFCYAVLKFLTLPSASAPVPPSHLHPLFEIRALRSSFLLCPAIANQHTVGMGGFEAAENVLTKSTNVPTDKLK